MSPRRRCIETRRGCSDDGFAVPGTSRCRAHTRKRACVCGAVDCQRHTRSGWATHRPPANSYAYGSGWSERARQVLQRDGYRCQLRYPDICVGRASQVDHIVQPEAGGGSDPANLRAVCVRCHARRTGRQGALAKQRRAAAKKRRK
jgi:5-methylcytosine-specific restriction protein A